MKEITAAEAGWKYSEYNLFAREAGSDKIAWLNTLSGSCSEFSLKEYVLIRQVLDLPQDHSLIAHYASRGLITNIDEKEEVRRRLSESCHSKDQLNLTICPTLACNFDCPYCFEKHRPGMMNKEVMDDIIRFVQRMLERHSFRQVHVVWFGGEPLLGIDIIESLSQRLIALSEEYKADYQAEIVTNGYLLNEHAVEVLADGKVTMAQITLDGLAAAHNKTRCLADGRGTFDVIVKNISEQKIPFTIQIRHNIIRENREEIEPLRQLIEELKEKSGNTLLYYAVPVFDSDAARERNREVSVLCGGEDSEFVYRDAFEHFTQKSMMQCEAARRYHLTIDHEGNLYTCTEKAGDSTEMYGNIRTYDPDDGIHTCTNPQLYSYYHSTEPLFEQCGDCVFLPRCLGQCPAKRRAGINNCPEYKDDPDAYVLHICRNLKALKKQRETETSGKEQDPGQG